MKLTPACAVAWLLALVLWVSPVLGIGMTIPPVLTGDKKKYSSLDNLLNCISYRTSKDDIIMVTVNSGDRIASQQLNLHVIDSENNVLRSMEDMADEQTIMFTNLNNPNQLEDPYKNLLGLSKRKKTRDEYKDLMNPHSGKSYVYICFDNIYFDKSWSFQKRSRDLSMSVHIRNMTTLKETNYNNYAKYFNLLKADPKADENNEFKLDFSEDDFEKAADQLQTLLNEISEELQSSYTTLQTLLEHEFKLRDVNEAIYEGYTRTAIMMITAICLFGAVQLIYYKCYFRSRKLI